MTKAPKRPRDTNQLAKLMVGGLSRCPRVLGPALRASVSQ